MYVLCSLSLEIRKPTFFVKYSPSLILFKPINTRSHTMNTGSKGPHSSGAEIGEISKTSCYGLRVGAIDKSLQKPVLTEGSWHCVMSKLEPFAIRNKGRNKAAANAECVSHETEEPAPERHIMSQGVNFPNASSCSASFVFDFFMLFSNFLITFFQKTFTDLLNLP